jgi:hypothetical protein
MLAMAALMPLSVMIAITESSSVAHALICVVTFAHMAWKTNLMTMTNDIYPQRVVVSVAGIVACGSGGILVDLLADTAFRLHPLTDLDAAEMVNGLKGVPLLRGYRGHPPVDEHAVVEALLRVSALMAIAPRAPRWMPCAYRRPPSRRLSTRAECSGRWRRKPASRRRSPPSSATSRQQ